MKSNNFYVELNGVANIKMLIDTLEVIPALDSGTVHAISRQLDYLERYMLAVAKAAREGEEKPPEWFRIIASPEEFPKRDGK